VIVPVASVQPPVVVTVRGAVPLRGETAVPQIGPLCALAPMVNVRHRTARMKRVLFAETKDRAPRRLERDDGFIGTVLLEQFRWKPRRSGLLDRAEKLCGKRS
jgi:hypothetical protein